ncbi:MAG: hypothetical protein QG652_929 [Pseudomonadota bacterium]|nr:hypothetical protein [Pseudomonadota bacterium]
MLKDLIKKALYQSGLLSLVHRRRNRHALTVVLFHRVFPPDDIRLLQADMEWTVTDGFFRDCLVFFRKHYNPVNLQQLQDFLAGGAALPDYPLLVTFDDGWLDNLEYAMPIAQQNAVRPLLFVTTGAIGKSMLSWQEILYSSWRIRQLPRERLDAIAGALQQPVAAVVTEQDIRQLIQAIQKSSAEIREKVARIIETFGLPHPVQMLDQIQLNQLAGYFDLGTHGVRHEPLTRSADPLAELRQARDALRDLTGQTLPSSMSFPHGRHDEALLQQAREAGYTMIFTGIRCHTLLQQKQQAVFGRHNMNQMMYQNEQGRLRPELLALYLFREPVREL